MNAAIQFLKRLDEAFDYFYRTPIIWKLLVLMTFLVLPVPIYHLTNPEMYTNTARLASAFIKEYVIINNLLLLVHIGAAVPAIVLGPAMFIAPLRNKYPAVHRKMGKIYVTGCLISAVSVFPLALSNGVGFVAWLGFGSMATMWAMTTWLGYCAVRNKDFVTHRRWLMRSYAITFAFVHVNLTYRLFLPYEYLTPQAAKAFQSMISWQFDLLVVEIYLAGTTMAGKFVGFRKWKTALLTWNAADRFYWRVRKA